MPLAVTKDQRVYFRKNKLLPLLELITDEEAKELLTAEGYDFHRQNDKQKKILLKGAYARLIGELEEIPKLRIAYTLTLTPEMRLPNKFTLQSIGSVSEVHGAWLFPLNSTLREKYKFYAIDEDSEEVPVPMDERKIGHAIYISNERKLTREDLQPAEGKAILVVYGGARMRYYINERDPHHNELKKYKYGNGDILMPDTHEFLYKK